LYFLGRYYLNRRKDDDLKNAIGSFRQAADLDPSYAAAWAGLADSYALSSVPGQAESISTEEALSKARVAARSAIQLDPNRCEPHSALGTIKLKFEWDWDGAKQDFLDAILLNPECGPAYLGLSNLYLTTGRFDDALIQAQKLKDLEPFSVTPELSRGRIFYFKRDYAKAEQIFSGILQQNPDNIRASFLLGFEYLRMGKIAEATKIFERINDTKPLLASAGLGYCYGKSGQLDKAHQVLNRLDDLGKTSYVSSQEKAIVYLGLGDTDNAFKYFEAACREKFPAFPGLLSDPLLDDIRSDPRFAGLRECARL
jgi:tetratricopeptide (TPR) repeat protein